MAAVTVMRRYSHNGKCPWAFTFVGSRASTIGGLIEGEQSSLMMLGVPSIRCEQIGDADGGICETVLLYRRTHRD